jgi:hypothetical protein
VQAETCSTHVKVTIWIDVNLCCVRMHKCSLFNNKLGFCHYSRWMFWWHFVTFRECCVKCSISSCQCSVPCINNVYGRRVGEFICWWFRVRTYDSELAILTDGRWGGIGRHKTIILRQACVTYVTLVWIRIVFFFVLCIVPIIHSKEHCLNTVY